MPFAKLLDNAGTADNPPPAPRSERTQSSGWTDHRQADAPADDGRTDTATATKKPADAKDSQDGGETVKSSQDAQDGTQTTDGSEPPDAVQATNTAAATDTAQTESATNAETLKEATQATSGAEAPDNTQATGERKPDDKKETKDSTQADASNTPTPLADTAPAADLAGGDTTPKVIVPHAAALGGQQPPAIGLAVAAAVAPPIAAEITSTDALPQAPGLAVAQNAVARNIEKHIASDGASKATSPQGDSGESDVEAPATGKPQSSSTKIDGAKDGKSHPDSEIASSNSHRVAGDLTTKIDLNAPSMNHGDTAGAVKTGSEAIQNLGLLASTGPANSAANATGAAMSTIAQAPAPAVAVPMSGLAVAIAVQAQAGKHHFEIRLDPPELGRIHVRLDVDRDGQVTSRLVVDRADTLDLLKRDAAQLERALQQAGLKTSDNALEFSLRQQSLARDDSTPLHTAELIVPDDDPTPLEALRRGYGRLLGLGGGLDIRV